MADNSGQDGRERADTPEGKQLDQQQLEAQRLRSAFKSESWDQRTDLGEYSRNEAGRRIGDVYADAIIRGIDVRSRSVDGQRAIQNMILTLEGRIGSRMDDKLILGNTYALLEQRREGFKKEEAAVVDVLSRDYFSKNPNNVDTLRSALLNESTGGRLTNREEEAMEELERGCRNGQEETDRHLAAAVHFGMEDVNRTEDQLNAISDQLDKVEVDLEVLIAQQDVLRLLLKYGELSDEVRKYVIDADTPEDNRPEKLGAFLADRATIEQYVLPADAQVIDTYFAALQAAGKTGRPDVHGTLAKIRGEREHQEASAYADTLVRQVGRDEVARADRPSLDKNPNN